MVAIGKKIRSIVRAVLFMVKKGLSKSQLMLELNMIMKRSKIAGKALTNLMFHHHHHHRGDSNDDEEDDLSLDDGPREYEFSCSNSPAYFPKRRRHRNRIGGDSPLTFDHAPPPRPDECDLETLSGVASVLEKLKAGRSSMADEEPSQALLGFGKSPKVRQLRVTDSPFPVHGVEDDSHVDEAAEEFIKKFYKQLRQQKRMAS